MFAVMYSGRINASGLLFASCRALVTLTIASSLMILVAPRTLTTFQNVNRPVASFFLAVTLVKRCKFPACFLSQGQSTYTETVVILPNSTAREI